MRLDRQLTQQRAEHAGRTYFFCSAGCRNEFQADPERYGKHTRAHPGPTARVNDT
jgi:Cu+-exporting ATPase